MRESRYQIIGLDKPVANPFATLADQAAVHEKNRLDSVAETLTLLGALALQRVFAGPELVTAGPAIFQFGTGVRSENTHAAHCLPGQILFSARPVHTMPGWSDDVLNGLGIKPLAMASKLRNLSGRTDVVDRTVNQVDSLIEKMRGGRGLKPLFGSSVKLLVERCSFQEPGNWGMLNELVRDAMDRYRLNASFACEERLDGLIDAQTRADSELQASTIQNKTIVAKEYLRIVQDGSFIPEAVTRGGFDDVIADVIRA